MALSSCRANFVHSAVATLNSSTQGRATSFSVSLARSTTNRLPLRSYSLSESNVSGLGRRGAGCGRASGGRLSVSVRSLNNNSQVAGDVSGDDKSGKEKVTVLVLGSGGREHSLCYGLRRSATCGVVFCAPGNAGIQLSGDAKCLPDLDITNSLAVAEFCKENGVGLVVVGPEGPLVSGMVDDLKGEGIPTFGPSAEAATLEGSKSFMKNLCDKYQIPTAKYACFTNAEKAKEYIQEQGAPIVVKADGLAAGKGVVVATALSEALDAVDSMLTEGIFGSAGGMLVVEEFLDGEEVSFFAIVDGENAVPLVSAQDHKRVGDGDTGPNTGGMGAYSPAPALTPELEKIVMDTIVLPTVRGMAKEGCTFVGVLYAGIIIEKKNGLPKLLEYNVRFGDPECQVLMMRLQSDLVQLLLAACKGELKGVELEWTDDPALVVVMASNGYPGDYKKGTMILNLEAAERYGSKVKLFHAGTALDSQENIVAAGGRVLGITAMGKDIVEAQKQAYEVVDQINWEEGFCRRDIGWRAVERCKENVA
ncbi:phosphoribosylamine---glycine ligase [Marchantia polymorpha subsp. ruderalis]